MSINVHLIDGTYELFRMYFGAPESKSPDGIEVGACRALLRSLASLLRRPEITHVGIAFDHEIKSFRNDLFDGYKTGEGIEPELLGQLSRTICVLGGGLRGESWSQELANWPLGCPSRRVWST